jgi:hypothetical protein
MKTVEKTQAQEIISELGPAIKVILERHGLDVPQMKWKYGDLFSLQMTAAPLEKGPHGINLGSAEARYYELFGFTGLSAPIGTVFISKGDAYAFAGIASKRPKYPIYAKNLITGDYSFFTEASIRLINAEASKASV